MLEVPASLEIDAARTAAFPAAVMLTRLADRVVARERRQGRAVERITVEVWSAALAGDGSGAQAVRLAHRAQDVAPDGPR